MSLKSFIRTDFGLWVTSSLLAAVIFFIMFTCRFSQQGRAQIEALIASGEVPIIIFWHEHIFAMPYFLPKPCSALQSPHPDGRVLAYAVRFFGLKPIWGSSNRNALSGLRQMAQQVKSGHPAVITPDGPRGPARILSAGPVGLSQLTGAPIIPVAWSAQRCWTLSSWDRMRIPKPFSSGLIVFGEPIRLEAAQDKAERDEQRQTVEARLTELTMDTDRRGSEHKITRDC